MKFDFKQIQHLVEKSTEIISKVSSVQKTLTDKDHKNEDTLKEMPVKELGSLTGPMGVATAIEDMIRQANETIQFCEEQKTIRTKIRAQSEVEISKINAMADLVRDYLARSFDERAEVFDNYFSVLDQALKDGDNMLVAQTLQSINSLAASSPFKDLTDINKVTEQLSAGTEWDI